MKQFLLELAASVGVVFLGQAVFATAQSAPPAMEAQTLRQTLPAVVTPEYQQGWLSVPNSRPGPDVILFAGSRPARDRLGRAPVRRH